MTYREDITDILIHVLATLENHITVTSWMANNGILTLETPDVKWAQEEWPIVVNCKTIENPNAHQVNCVFTEVQDTFVRIKGVTETLTEYADGWVQLPLQKFFHGTPIATGAELNQIQKAVDKTPMVWMMENFTERFLEDELQRLERETDLRLFFLTQANHNQWMTETAYHKAIRPMRRFMELFVQALKNDSQFDTLELTYSVQNYSKFGVYINEKGMPTNKFADNLSGVEMQFTLKRYRPDCCC
jgi:hypothetical protein